jgi:type I restriction enzyme S subunit
LLERAARILYKEWFVHLRFPGHEHLKIIDDVPDGWERKKVAEIIRRVPAGKLYNQKSAFTKGKVPILDQGRSGLIGFHDEEPSVQPTLDSPVIVFANHTCYQRIIHFPFSTIQNVLPFVPSKKYKRNIYWLHYATEGLVKLSAYKGHWPEFMAKETLIPPMGLCSRFGQAVKDNHLMIYWLEEQNKSLTQARDLLLPRLMNGEISA